MSSSRKQFSLPPDVLDRMEKIAVSQGTSVSALIRESFERAYPPTADPSERNIVEFLLRPGEPEPENGPSWSNGGRWFLEWLLQSEPDHQQHHTVMFPRHWPIPLDRPDLRCPDGHDNSVNAELRDNVENGDFPDGADRITLDEWLQVCARFRGCCGERIRPPAGPHWDAVCGPSPEPETPAS